MAEYMQEEGPIPTKEPEDSGVLCPGCSKVNLVVKVKTGKDGRNETQHLLCEKCNYQDQRIVDKVSGDVVMDRSKTF